MNLLCCIYKIASRQRTERMEQNGWVWIRTLKCTLKKGHALRVQDVKVYLSYDIALRKQWRTGGSSATRCDEGHACLPRWSESNSKA
jgi:hypothetical protein